MKPTKEQIRAALVESARHEEGHPEYGIYTEAEAMVNGGSHHWYIGQNGDDDVRCYGQGPGWCDQSDESSCTLAEAVDHIHNDLRIIQQ